MIDRRIHVVCHTYVFPVFSAIQTTSAAISRAQVTTLATTFGSLVTMMAALASDAQARTTVGGCSYSKWQPQRQLFDCCQARHHRSIARASGFLFILAVCVAAMYFGEE
jgi:hypothetical protein